MEEQHSVQIINIFLRSSEIEELKIDIFDSCDILIAGFTINNYKRHTIHLKKRIPHFYCVLIDQPHRIEEQIELKMTDEQPNTIQCCKKFANFAITVEVELRKPLQAEFMLENFLQQQNELLKFANAHLRKLEGSVLKQLEVEELRKPLGQKGKNSKGPSIRKIKSKLNFTTLIKLPSGSQKRLQGKGYVETLKSLGRGKHKATDESQQSMEDPTPNQATLRIKKYNTLFYNNPVCHTQASSKETPATAQTAVQPEPLYSQFVKVFQTTFQQPNQRCLRRSREARLSHNQQLAFCTLQEIEKQKKALEMIKIMSGKYSQQNSPIKILEQKINRHKRSSPYLPLSSKAFIKRKIK